MLLLALASFSIIYSISVVFESNSASDESYRNVDWIYVNASASDAVNVSVFIDFDESIVGWWRMDDLNGSGDVVDYFGNHNASLVGDAQQTSTGVLGNGFFLDGDGDYLAIPDNDQMDFHSTDFSIFMWINTSTTANVAFITKRGGGEPDWYFGSQSTNTLLFFDSADLSRHSNTVTFRDGNWHQIGVTREGTTLTFYFDGSPAGTGSSDTSFFDNNDILIGADAELSNDRMNGTIDDVIIFNRSLTADEALALYINTTARHFQRNFTGLLDDNHSITIYGQNITGGLSTLTRYVVVDTVVPNSSLVLPTPTNGSTQNHPDIFVNVSSADDYEVSTFVNFDDSLVSWWRMDENNGTHVFDYIERNNGTFIDDPTITEGGYLGKGVSLDGDGDYIDVGTSVYGIAQELSVFAWVNIAAHQSYNVLWGGYDTNEGLAISIRKPASTVYYAIHSGDGSAGFTPTSAAITLNENEWYFVGFVFNGSHFLYYLDGDNFDSDTSSILLINDTTTSGSFIGREGSISANRFNGTIDDLMIFNRSLSIEEVSALYANSSSKIRENNFTGLSGGLHTVTAYTQDRAGNINTSETREINLNLPPVINSHAPSPSLPIENQLVYIYANVTDDYNNLSWVNFTITAPNGSIIVDNVNATSRFADIYNSTSFNATSTGTWTWNITAFDGLSQTKATGSFSIVIWHTLVGNITGSLVLQGNNTNSLVVWSVSNTSESNIFIADSDSSINFNSLASFGRNLSNATRIGDFVEIDSLIKTSNFTDSVNNTYTSAGLAITEYNFTIFSKTLYYVPIINSTNTSTFFTGILWDSSDDNDGGTAGEFDSVDKEDVVFITVARDNLVGAHGTYDYEIRVPAALRKYLSATTTSVALYGEIK